jgi:hypothetical protein
MQTRRLEGHDGRHPQCRCHRRTEHHATRRGGLDGRSPGRRDVVSDTRRRSVVRAADRGACVAAWTRLGGRPWASVPCARRQLERIRGLCAAAGLRVESAAVGDPDPLSAIDDAVHAGSVDEVLLFARGRQVAAGYPLSVACRAGRLVDVPVHSVATPRAASRRRRLVLAGGRCDVSLARSA